MAGASGETEENYWPGYVDALTTMTMVLTFIMMVLGVVIFSMSQNVSKAIIESVAAAAHVDVPTSGSVEERRAALVKSLERASDPKPPAAAAAPVAATDGPPPNLERSAGPTAATAPPPPKEQPSQAATVSDPTIQPPNPVPHVTASADVPPLPKPVEDGQGSMLQGRETGMPASPQAERKRIESTAIMPERSLQGAVGTSRSGPIVTLTFKKGVVQLDTASAGEFKKIFSDPTIIQAGVVVDVKGYADMDGIAVTESRRVAYYRAMLVRTNLIESGVPANRIKVRVEPGKADEADLVRIFLAN